MAFSDILVDFFKNITLFSKERQKHKQTNTPTKTE